MSDSAPAPRAGTARTPLIVPFLTRVDETLHARWLAELRAAFAAEGTIEPRAFETLTSEERQAVRVAIVADPDTADLAALPALEWVQSLWAGVETLVAAFTGRDVGIARLVDPRLGDAMAETVLAWTLYLHRDMPRYLAQQRARTWRAHAFVPAGERRVGVLGLGALGARTARALADAGFDVAGWSRSPKSLDGLATLHGADGFRTLLARSDVLVVLLPLTTETHGLIDAPMLARLPRGACLVNAARGPIVAEAALLDALDTGRVEHAVLDVFDREPLPHDHRYWSHSGVSVMPHVAAPTDRTSAARIAARAITRWSVDGEPPDLVDRQRGY